MHGEVLTPVVGDGDLQVVDAAALRLERVRQVRSHVQNVLQHLVIHNNICLSLIKLIFIKIVSF